MENSNLIPAGVYNARVVDYGISETKNKMPQVFITMNVKASESEFRKLTWFGSLKDVKANPNQQKTPFEITFETLIRCGYKLTDLVPLADGVQAGHLDVNKTMSVTIEHDTYEGKTNAKIRWINNLGGVQSKLDKAGAVQKLAGLNLQGKAMQMAQEFGVLNNESTGQNYETAQSEPSQEHGEIPF